jgi:hypothetical protein
MTETETVETIRYTADVVALTPGGDVLLIERAPTDGRPQLVDLGRPLFTDLPSQGPKPFRDKEPS